MTKFASVVKRFPQKDRKMRIKKQKTTQTLVFIQKNVIMKIPKTLLSRGKNMLKTKIISSQQKAFIDDSIDHYPRLEKISVLRGEKLSFQLLYVDEGEEYLPVRPYCNIEVKGALAKHVIIRDVRNVPVERPINPDKYDSNYLRTTPGIYPDILTPLRYGGKMIISRNKLRSLWIELEIPTDAEGSYDIDVSISLIGAAVGDTETAELSGAPISTDRLTVDVIAAALPEQKLIFTQWFYADCLASYYNVPVWSDQHFAIIENFVKTGVKRGRNMLYTPLLTPALNVLEPYRRVPTQLVDVTCTNGVYSFGFDNLDRWVDMCDRSGVKYLEISHFYHQDQARHSAKVYGMMNGKYTEIFGWNTLSTDPEYVRFLREMITAFLSHMKKRGDDKRCYFHISDEPKLKNLDQYLTVKNNIADLLSDYVIMDALSDFEFYKSGAVDCPVPVTRCATPFINAGVKDLWTYYAGFTTVKYSNCIVSVPSWRTRSIGMQLYKYNIVGFLHWGYNYYNNRASGDAINPYLDLGGEDWVPAGDTFMVYPNSDGTPLESLRMVVFEEAIQDIRAMQLAEACSSHEEVVAAMEKALGDEITFERCALNEDEMLKVREAVNELIRRNCSEI